MIAAQTRSLAEEFQPEGQLAKAVWYVSLALVGTALMTLAAKTKVDMVFVNVTMQTFAVFAISAAYGSRLAVATMALYLLEGALGMPVFTGTPEKGIGLAYMVGPDRRLSPVLYRCRLDRRPRCRQRLCPQSDRPWPRHAGR